MERKLRVENRFLNRHEQTCHEHDQFTFHALVRITGRLVRVAFTSMLIEIAGIQLVLINLHDTRCAGRGEVSRVGASHRDEVNVAFDAHLYGTWAIFAEAPLLFKLLLRVLRRGLFSPWAKSYQVVRGHAYRHPARNYFGERRPDARVLRSRPHLSLSHGLKAAA